MSEVLWKENNDEIVLQDRELLFAYGEESSSVVGLLIFGSLLSFAFLLTFFKYLLKNIGFFSSDVQFFIAFFISIAVCVFSSLLIYKKATTKIKVPVQERKNLIKINFSSKTVTLLQEKKVKESFILSKGDYFWFPRPIYRKVTLYTLNFVHNNIQYAIVASSGSFSYLHQLTLRLTECGLPVRDDNANT